MSSYSWRLEVQASRSYRPELKDRVGMNYLAVNSSLMDWQDSREYLQGAVKARRNLLPLPPRAGGKSQNISGV